MLGGSTTFGRPLGVQLPFINNVFYICPKSVYWVTTCHGLQVKFIIGTPKFCDQ